MKENINELMPVKNLKNKIYTIRNTPVMLDSDLAKLYDIPTKRLNQAVKRNKERFPEDFMFQLTQTELEFLENFSENTSVYDNRSRSQFVTSNKQGGRQYLPFVFTEQGVAMLSGILKSKRAIKVNIFIMRAFVDMRRFLQTNAELFLRVDNVIKKQLKQDKDIKIIFEKIGNKKIIKKQNVFYNGQIFDAYVLVNDILKKAEKTIILIDNFVDESVLVLFSEIKDLKIKIYTENITNKLKLDLEKYNHQYNPIEIKKLNNCHDRFLIIDDKEIYHFGASIKDLGKKWFAFSKMHKSFIKLIIEKIDLTN